METSHIAAVVVLHVFIKTEKGNEIFICGLTWVHNHVVLLLHTENLFLIKQPEKKIENLNLQQPFPALKFCIK